MTSKVEGNSQRLLPGILDDIALNKVIPKLQWRDLYALSAVSSDWCRVIRSRQAYNLRVLHHSKETAVLVRCENDDRNHSWFALYSMTDNSCRPLPRIPDIASQLFPTCKCVPLEGKICILGGFNWGNPEVSRKVYVLDLVEQGQWKRCADMIQAREDFACSVMDGKIFVLGGVDRRVSCGSEVYNPDEDTWSPISPPPAWVISDQVEVVGDKFMLIRPAVKSLAVYDNNNDDEVVFYRDEVFDVYNPTRDQWRRKTLSSRSNRNSLFFMAHGKLHQMRDASSHRIEVHNADENSWSHLHSSIFRSVGPIHSTVVEPLAVLALQKELLAIVAWWTRGASRRAGNINGYCLLRSEGFGTNTEAIRWQRALDLDGPFGWRWMNIFPTFSMYPIQL